MIAFQDLKVTNEALMPELLEAAARVIRSGRYINGPEVTAFEKALAELVGTDFCIAVSTGLDALRLILRAYKELGRLSDGDEVIIPANTFIATFLAVTDCGLVAVPADVDESTFCLDFERLPLTSRTRAIITVHLYGNPCWSSRLNELHNRGIIVIEDNAQAIGAVSAVEGFSGNFSTGALADAAAFSFYPAKNIGALGDAGAVTTDDPELAKIVRQLANYGSSEKYFNDLCGFNCRMDELQAALLSVKLPHTKDIIRERADKAILYSRLITNPEVKLPKIFDDGAVQAWHQFVVRHPRRDALRSFLAGNGVSTEIHYPVPCHLQKCYFNNPSLKIYGDIPVAESLANEVLSLPLADVSNSDIERIAGLINSFS